MRGGLTTLAAYVAVATIVVVLAARVAAFGWDRWLMLHLTTVVWPAIWTYLALRANIERRFAWAPVVVGGTGLAAAVMLVGAAIR